MATGAPDYTRVIFSSGSNKEQLKISATDAEAASAFAQQVRSVIIYNDGPNPVHLNFDATATTNHFKLPSKAWFMLDIPLTNIDTICAAGLTATLYCIGVF